MLNRISHYNAFAFSAQFTAVLDAARTWKGFQRAYRRLMEYILFPRGIVIFHVDTQFHGDQTSIFKYNIVEKLIERTDIRDAEIFMCSWLMEAEEHMGLEFPEFKTLSRFNMSESFVNKQAVAVPYIEIDLHGFEDKSKEEKKEMVKYLDALLWGFRENHFMRYVSIADWEPEYLNEVQERLNKEKSRQGY
jgi:hypothetical protein